MSSMREQVEETERDAVLVEDAALIRMMGYRSWRRSLRGVPYEQVDPFILVHEGRFRLSELAGKSTPSIRTEGSTTSGTCWKDRPAPVTAPGPAERWSGHG